MERPYLALVDLPLVEEAFPFQEASVGHHLEVEEDHRPFQEA